MTATSAAWIFCAVGIALLCRPGLRRLQLSLAKHRSLAGHARLSKRFAAFIPFYEYTADRIFRVDGAPPEIEAMRRAGFAHLSAEFARRFERTRARTAHLQSAVPDLEFTARYRVPFQFSRFVQEHLAVGALLEASSGACVSDVDGNQLYDLTGSYGVNAFGIDFYKECIERGVDKVRELGPVLGAYHPVIAYNVRRLTEISGLEAVSFHMSGTEAVMQAVRLARYHTGKRRLVRFCGAYHGWWGDVQPGIGNPSPAPDTFTLKEMDAATLRVLETRRDVACVLVNPLQCMHPNAGAPADSALIDSSRCARVDRTRYGEWLRRLRDVCTRRGIVLIFDEVFVGFRLALGGAQEYFGVRADLVTYGKTLGGGLPVGVLCGRQALMRRFRAEHPADICFARGTFNTHPYVMGAMHELLRHLETEAVVAAYAGLDERWNARAAALNARLRAACVPVEVVNLSSIWTVNYLRPACYNWMFQFYLRAAGLALSWVGTGRLIFSLDFREADFAAVADRFVAAAVAMQRDGWWDGGLQQSNSAIRRRVLAEMIRARWRSAPARSTPRAEGAAALCDRA